MTELNEAAKDILRVLDAVESIVVEREAIRTEIQNTPRVPASIVALMEEFESAAMLETSMIGRGTLLRVVEKLKAAIDAENGKVGP